MRTSLLLSLLLISASVQAAPTFLECTVTGSQTNPKENRTVSETLEVRVDEDYPNRIISVTAERATFVAFGAQPPGAVGFKIEPQDRSTKDVWDMEMQEALEEKYNLKKEDACDGRGENVVLFKQAEKLMKKEAGG